MCRMTDANHIRTSNLVSSRFQITFATVTRAPQGENHRKVTMND